MITSFLQRARLLASAAGLFVGCSSTDGAPNRADASGAEGAANDGEQGTGDGAGTTCGVSTTAGEMNIFGATCYPLTAMPQGACTGDEGGQCAFCAYRPCAPGGTGPRTFYECACTGGTWSCGVVSEDGSSCPPCPAAEPAVGGACATFELTCGYGATSFQCIDGGWAAR